MSGFLGDQQSLCRPQAFPGESLASLHPLQEWLSEALSSQAWPPHHDHLANSGVGRWHPPTSHTPPAVIEELCEFSYLSVANFSSFVSNFDAKAFQTPPTSAFNFTVPLGYLFQLPGDPGFVIIPRNFNTLANDRFPQSNSPNLQTLLTPENSSICRMVSFNNLTRHSPVLSPSFQPSHSFISTRPTTYFIKPGLRHIGHAEISSLAQISCSLLHSFTTSLSTSPPGAAALYSLGLLWQLNNVVKDYRITKTIILSVWCLV